jgi:hypothetical protein
VLKVNGFKPDEPYSLVLGGTELNKLNTFRVSGNHDADTAVNNDGGYTEEFRTPPGETGIWRFLKFKNLIVSYGQVPRASA